MNDSLRFTGLTLSDSEQTQPWAARVLTAALDVVQGKTLAQLAADMGVGQSRLSAMKDPKNEATIALSKIVALPDSARAIIARAFLGDGFAVVALPEVAGNVSNAELHKETSDVVTCALVDGPDFDREADEAIAAILRRKMANVASRAAVRGLRVAK